MRKPNALWEGHRMILPEMREKYVATCRECRFFVRIQGKEETRWGCVVTISSYGNLEQRVPRLIHALDILKMVGKEGLNKVITRGDSLSNACELFRHR